MTTTEAIEWANKRYGDGLTEKQKEEYWGVLMWAFGKCFREMSMEELVEEGKKHED